MGNPLRDLALAQAQNPQNSWLAQNVPQAVQDYANGGPSALPLPTNQAPPAPLAMNSHSGAMTPYQYAGSDATPDILPPGTVISADGKVVPMSNVNDNTVPLPKTAKEAVDWNNLNTPKAPAAAPAAKPAITPQSLGAKPATLSSGHSGTDPTKTWLSETGANIEKQQGVLGEQGAALDKQKDILTQGAETAGKLSQIAEANDQANALSLNMMTDKAKSDTAYRSAEIERRTAEVREEEKNPYNWFHDKGTAGSILSAIAIAGGAFAAAMPHTNNNTNQALGIITDAINRDTMAHQKRIDGMWKNIEFSVGEDQRKFAKDQFMINQRNEVRRADYTHAIALVDRQIANTNNAAAIQGMELTKLGLKDQSIKLDQTMTDHRRDVGLYEQKAAAAAAAANPFSAVNANKAYMSYVEKATDANLQHPDKPVPLMSRDQWLPGYLGQGREKPDASGGKGAQDQKAQAEFESGVEGVGKKAGDAAKADTGAWFLSHLPQFVAPESNLIMQHLHQYNDSMLPAALRLLGDRVPPDTIKEQIKDFSINWNDPPQVAKDKAIQFQSFLRVNSQVGQGKKGPTAPDTEQ